MKDNIKTLLKYLIYAFLLVMVVIYGIKHPSALEKTLYSDNNNGTLSNSNFYRYGYINSGGVQSETTASINTTINGTAIAFRFYYYEPVNLNNTYTMEINFMSNDLLKIFNSNMVHVYSCVSDVCNPMSIISVTKNNPTGNSNKLTIEFNPVSAGSYIYTNLSNSTSATTITGISTFGIKNVNLTTKNNNQDIIDNQTNNTNNIINNNNSNTQEIIDSSSSNTQIIVENQDKIKKELIDAQYTCKIWSITLSKYISIQNARLNTSGSAVTNGNYNITDYIKIMPNMPYSITLNYDSGQPGFCIYDKDLNVINCESYNNRTTIDFTSSSSAQYIRFSVHKQSTTNITTFGGNICLKDSEQQTNAINDLNDSINSTDFDISGLDNVVGWLPPGPVDSILTLPLNLFNAYTVALGLTCSPLNIPLPYVNKNLPIPCIRSIFQEIGVSTWWEGFGYLAAAIILYNYLLNLYTWVDKTLTLRENTMPGYYDDNFGGGA